MNRPHDADYKAFFARWEVVESLLVDFRPELGLNPVLVGNLIYARTVITNPEYVTKESKRRQADMVYQIPGRLIAPDLRMVPDVELMAEFQGTYEPEMDERVRVCGWYRTSAPMDAVPPASRCDAALYGREGNTCSTAGGKSGWRTKP